jgi:hypothetical protein
MLRPVYNVRGTQEYFERFVISHPSILPGLGPVSAFGFSLKDRKELSGFYLTVCFVRAALLATRPFFFAVPG